MIYCANNNTLYKKAADICEDLNVDPGNVSRVLAGRLLRVRNYCFCELNEPDRDQISSARRYLLYTHFNIVLPDEFVNPQPRIYGGDTYD